MAASTCEVLRCTAGRDHVLVVSAPDYPRMEVAICDGHQQAIDAGARWYYNCDEQLLYMGEDLRALGMNRVTDIEVVSQADRMSGEGVHSRLRIAYENAAGGDAGFVDLLLTEELRTDLAAMLR